MGSRELQWSVPWWGSVQTMTYPETNFQAGITAALVDTEVYDDQGDQIEALTTDVWCERIVGQYRLYFDEMSFNAGYESMDFHHRVYPVSQVESGVLDRDLISRIEADSDWMWHHIESFATFTELAADQAASLGSWGVYDRGGGTGRSVGVRPFQAGRMGHFDIRVGRLVRAGEIIVWKTQPNNNAAPSAGTIGLELWVRTLTDRRL